MGECSPITTFSFGIPFQAAIFTLTGSKLKMDVKILIDSRPAAVSSVQLDNDRVRVTRWSFEVGAATGWHRHEHDYVVVPITTGRLLIKDKYGDSYAELTAGISYNREFGVEHDVINANDFEFVFIEVELKS